MIVLEVNLEKKSLIFPITDLSEANKKTKLFSYSKITSKTSNSSESITPTLLNKDLFFIGSLKKIMNSY